MSEEPTQNFLNNTLQIILARLDKIDSRLDNMESRLNSMESRLDSMESRLEKLEARAYDTKPIWENALEEIVEINGKLVELNGKIDGLRSDTESGFRRVERKIDVLNQNILDVRADSRELEERVDKLEIRPSH